MPFKASGIMSNKSLVTLLTCLLLLQPLKRLSSPLNNQLVLYLMHPLFKLRLALPLSYLHFRRDNRLTGIHLRNNLMYHHPRPCQPFLLPRLPRPPNRIRARKLARQRRMQIDDLDPCFGDGVEEVWCDNVHPARAHNQVRARLQIENYLREIGVVAVAC